VLFGVMTAYGLLFTLRPLIDNWYGLYLDIAAPDFHECLVLALIVGGGALAGLLPALRAYRQSLSDGMSIRN